MSSVAFLLVVVIVVMSAVRGEVIASKVFRDVSVVVAFPGVLAFLLVLLFLLPGEAVFCVSLCLLLVPSLSLFTLLCIPLPLVTLLRLSVSLFLLFFALSPLVVVSFSFCVVHLGCQLLVFFRNV